MGIDLLDRGDNYFALVAAVLNPKLSIDDAINRFSPMPYSRRRFNQQEIEEMRRLKERMSYTKVGELFGVSANTIYRRLKGVV